MSMSAENDLRRYPGGDLVAKGLSDVQTGCRSQEALLVLIARPRLTALGFELNPGEYSAMSSEHLLYEVLEETHGPGAHSAYNALIRKIVSFARAYSAAQRVNGD